MRNHGAAELDARGQCARHSGQHALTIPQHQSLAASVTDGNAECESCRPPCLQDSIFCSTTSLTRRCSVLFDPSVQAKKILGLKRWGQVLGTGCGSVESPSQLRRGNKKGHLLAFF